MSDCLVALQTRVRKAYNELNTAIDGWKVRSCLRSCRDALALLLAGVRACD